MRSFTSQSCHFLGADVRHTDAQGLTALDSIHDYDEWIDCPFSYEDKVPYFNDEITSRFKGTRETGCLTYSTTMF